MIDASPFLLWFCLNYRFMVDLATMVFACVNLWLWNMNADHVLAMKERQNTWNFIYLCYSADYISCYCMITVSSYIITEGIDQFEKHCII